MPFWYLPAPSASIEQRICDLRTKYPSQHQDRYWRTPQLDRSSISYSVHRTLQQTAGSNDVPSGRRADRILVLYHNDLRLGSTLIVIVRYITYTSTSGSTCKSLAPTPLPSIIVCSILGADQQRSRSLTPDPIQRERVSSIIIDIISDGT